MRAVATDYAIAGVLLHLMDMSSNPAEVFNLTVETLSDDLRTRVSEEFTEERTRKFVKIIQNIGLGTFYDDPFADPIFQISTIAIRNFFQERASAEDVFSRAWNLNLKWVSTAYQKEEFWQAVDSEDVTIASRLPTPEHGPTTVTHNQKAFKEANELIEELLQKLRTGNDLGKISDEDLPSVIGTVEEIQKEFQSGTVTMPSFGNKARNLLSWIASEAGGAVVGNVAIAALLALLKVLEIPF